MLLPNQALHRVPRPFVVALASVTAAPDTGRTLLYVGGTRARRALNALRVGKQYLKLVTSKRGEWGVLSVLKPDTG